MVVSDRNVASNAQSDGGWHSDARTWIRHLAARIHRFIGFGRSLNLTGQVARSRRVPGGRMVRYITMPQHQTDFLLERSTLLFRRENQGESFDDDVSALRDQVGAGRRDESGTQPDVDDDQTAYTPPPPSWSPSDTPAESTRYERIPQPASREPVEAGDASVIAPDTRWDGNVQSRGALHIYGSVSGQISAEGDVYVAEGASVSAEVRAGSVTVAGTVEGSVECSGRFEVLPSGRVSADVAAPRLVVHEGALVVGNLRMTSGQGAAE